MISTGSGFYKEAERREESFSSSCTGVENVKNWIITEQTSRSTPFPHISVFSDTWSSLKNLFDSCRETEVVWGGETGIWQAVEDQDPRWKEEKGKEGKNDEAERQMETLSPGRQSI